MPTDYSDVDEFLKGRGITLPEPPKVAPAPTSAPSAAPSVGPPSAQAAPDQPPAPAEADFRPSARHAQEWRSDFQRGFGRGATRFGLAASDLASSVAPQAKEWLKQSFPSLSGYAKSAREFTAEKPTGTAQSMGETAGEIAPGMLIPGGSGRLAKRAVLSAFPRTQAVPVFTAGQGFVTQQAPKMIPRWGRTAARTAGTAASVGQQAGASALTGAAANPDDPASGAIAGAAGGLAGRGVGRLLQSPIGRGLGSLAATEGAFYGIHKATGLPYYPLIGPIATHRYLLGGPLRRFGDRVFDNTGRFVGRLHPAIQGHIAGKVAEGQDISGALAELYRQVRPEQSNAQEPRP